MAVTSHIRLCHHPAGTAASAPGPPQFFFAASYTPYLFSVACSLCDMKDTLPPRLSEYPYGRHRMPVPCWDFYPLELWLIQKSN